MSRGSVTLALWVRKGPFPRDLLLCPFTVQTSGSRFSASRPYAVSQPKGNCCSQPGCRSMNSQLCLKPHHLSCCLTYSRLVPQNGHPRGSESELSGPEQGKAGRLDLGICTQNLQLGSATFLMNVAAPLCLHLPICKLGEWPSKCEEQQPGKGTLCSTCLRSAV